MSAMLSIAAVACSTRSTVPANSPVVQCLAKTQRCQTAHSNFSQITHVTQRTIGAIRVAHTVRATQVEAQPSGPGKLISKTEIPAFIPRQDLLDQLTRWAFIDIQEEGVENLGIACKVGAVVEPADSHWLFLQSFDCF